MSSRQGITTGVRTSRRPWLSRRRFWLGAVPAGLLLLLALALLDMRVLEPRGFRIRTISVPGQPVACRIVHISDWHYHGKGDEAYAARVVAAINRLKPDLVCFTGDLIEEADQAAPALAWIRRIQCPVYGVPGNHEDWSKAGMTPFRAAFAATGGAWLEDEKIELPQFRLEITGFKHPGAVFKPPRTQPVAVALLHFPRTADALAAAGRHYTLLLSGHSHGGQVRLPFYGALITPYETGPYDLGRYDTPAGLLYVNPGLGTWFVPWRFLCRPEITVFDLARPSRNQASGAM